MKNTIKLQSRLLCAIALLAIIAFSMVACSSDESVSLQGTTWKWSGKDNKGVAFAMILTFPTASAFKLELKGNRSGTLTGSYTFNGHSGTMIASTGTSDTFSVSGTKLTMKEPDGSSYIFTKY